MGFNSGFKGLTAIRPLNLADTSL